jgi:hypothetical protein
VLIGVTTEAKECMSGILYILTLFSGVESCKTILTSVSNSTSRLEFGHYITKKNKDIVQYTHITFMNILGYYIHYVMSGVNRR